MITTACNAATMPVIGPYLDELQKWLPATGFGGSVLMMLSNGGVVSADDAARVPIRLVESGPAAGALAGSVVRPPPRRGPPAVLRHGRHHRQVVPHRPRRARAHEHVRGRPHVPLQEGLGLPRVGAVGRSRRDRRRRRQPRARRRARPAQGRPRIERRRSRSGVLRPRRHASRRSPTPTSCSACSTPATSSAATCRSTLAANAHAVRIVADRLGLDLADTAAGMHELVNQNMAAAARMHAVEQGVDLRGVAAARVRRRRAGARLRRRRAARVAARRSSRSTPACSRRSARWSRRCESTSPARWCARSTAIDHERARRPARRPARRGTSCACRRRACPPTPSASATALDARYLGQGNEITVWVGDGEHGRSADDAGRAQRVRGGLPPRSTGSRSPTSACRGRHVAPVGVLGGRRSSSRRPSPTGRGATPAGRRPVVFERGQPARRDDGLQARVARCGRRVRGPGDRRGARDHDRHPPWLARRSRPTDGIV